MVRTEGAGGLIVFLILSWLWLFSAIAAAIYVNRGPVRSDVAMRCPFCRSRIRRDANVCPHCRREVAAMEHLEGNWWSRDDQGNPVWLDRRTGRWERAAESPAAPSKRTTAGRKRSPQT